MKSVNQIKDEMNELQVQLSTTGALKKAAISKIKKRYVFLKMCTLYIETNPSVEFLKKEKDRLNSKINLINSGYIPNQKFIDNGMRREEQKEHKDYNKIMGLAKFKEQLRSIQFLIS